MSHTPSHSGSRLLAIYDLRSQPYSYGDFILFQAGSLVAAETLGCEITDICVLADEPSVDPTFQRLVPSDGRLGYFLPCLAGAQSNPRLGDVHLLNDRSGLRRLLDARGPESPCWPAVEKLQDNEYLFYPIHRLLAKLHAAKDRRPFLSMPPSLIAWAGSFIESRVSGRMPVSVSLRNNPHFHPHRNAVLSEWIAFFNRCENDLPVHFFVMCLPSETDERLRGLSNVTVCKDAYTTLEQELAVIQVCRFHMGSASGPSIFPVFTDKPYLVVHADMLPHMAHYGGALYLDPEGFLRYTFAAPWQRFSIDVETRDFLYQECEQILSHLERNSEDEPGEVEAKRCLRSAEHCQASGNNPSARLLFQRATRLQPRDAGMLYQYGMFLLHLGEEVAARGMLLRASVLEKARMMRLGSE